jgi:hypothetical protein
MNEEAQLDYFLNHLIERLKRGITDDLLNDIVIKEGKCKGFYELSINGI